MSGKGPRSSSPGSRGSGGTRGSGSRGGVKTPPNGTRRPSGRGEPVEDSRLNQVVRGREVEFWGIGLVSLGLLLALSIYVPMAGPLGRGIDTMFGWLFGLGRFTLPLVTAFIGIAMVRRRSVEHRVRLSAGWAVLVLAVLGFLHLVNGADSIIAGADEMARAGGWFGAIICEPLRNTVSWAGALVVLLAAGVLGTMLVTDTSLPELIDLIKQRTAGLNEAREEARRAREERADTMRRQPGMYDLEEDDAGEPDEEPQRRSSRRRPKLYDFADDFGPAPEKKPRTKRVRTEAEPQTPEFHQKPGMAHRSDDVGIAAATSSHPGQWVLPSTDLLTLTAAHEVNLARVEERGKLLEEALASHGVETRLLGKTVGPTVTRFELELGAGVKVAKVTSLARDIAYSMAATDVRILAPIPGKSAIGVEVPNESRQLVSLGDLMVSPEARAATHPLEVAVGKDIAGRAVFMNLASTPHLLIAGATGAGKSSGINSILTSLLMRSTPDEVRLILIDPKQVEMGQYARLPHLLTAPVTNPKKAANALGWAVKEMERRYDLLVEAGYRDIGGYNAAHDRGELVQTREDLPPYERLPFIVVVVDELNDLMMVAARDVEECITRIAQKARAVGIHLIVATQRPSVNVITGVIKANIPARMAFAVSSLTDSRVILDQPGAEKLVGKGDMLLLPGNTNIPQRIQGSWVDEEEVRQVVAHWRAQSPEIVYVSGIEGEEGSGSSGQGDLFGGSGGGDSDLLRQAMEIVVRSGLGSTSLLQRKLKVGFARAGRLMDELEERGVVGPSEGSKARAVLMTVEELDSLG